MDVLRFNVHIGTLVVSGVAGNENRACDLARTG